MPVQLKLFPMVLSSAEGARHGYGPALKELTDMRHTCEALFHLRAQGTVGIRNDYLMRSVLSPAEEAWQVARRKVIYEELHPETRSTSDGGPGRAKQTRRQNGDDTVDRFTTATAKAAGKSERVDRREYRDLRRDLKGKRQGLAKFPDD